MSTPSSASSEADVVRSLVPARMDRLPWSAFHWRMIIALGITWILDGVEIGLASAIGQVLRKEETLGLSTEVVAISGGLYLFGEVVGALYFGRQADRLGRRKLFVVTLALYLIANALTALSFSTWFFLLTRFAAGMGIGGEYAAIHSAIDELTPAKYRGRVDIAIAGTYWAGAAIAAGAQILVLGTAIGLMIWPLRKYIPESPRWQLMHGQVAEAEATVARIEEEIIAKGIELPAVDPSHAVVVRQNERIGWGTMLGLLFGTYGRRTVLSLGLMITQSFLYNAIFFTYTLILVDFYKVDSAAVGYYIFPFAAGNLAGPLLIGRFFDTIGRRKMISLTYCTSAILLAISGWMFHAGMLTATTQVVMWCIIFFIASAAASSAYLTVSEIYPVEMRAQAISVIFAIAQSFGATAPPLFGFIIARAVDPDTHVIISRVPLALAYVGCAVVMFSGGLI